MVRIKLGQGRRFLFFCCPHENGTFDFVFAEFFFTEPPLVSSISGFYALSIVLNEQPVVIGKALICLPLFLLCGSLPLLNSLNFVWFYVQGNHLGDIRGN